MGYNHAYCRSEGKTKRLVVADYHLNEKKYPSCATFPTTSYTVRLAQIEEAITSLSTNRIKIIELVIFDLNELHSTTTRNLAISDSSRPASYNIPSSCIRQ